MKDMVANQSKKETKLVRGAIFADYRCHTVFSDGTGIIIHKSGGSFCRNQLIDSFTYFHANGKKERQLIQYATMKDGILSKLKESVAVFTNSPILS